uniref:Uncharacterized protein n=1 Tax=Anguilla anguilla TaxID=7936 RepID=A0A0E9W266_ANGAN
MAESGKIMQEYF